MCCDSTQINFAKSSPANNTLMIAATGMDCTLNPTILSQGMVRDWLAVCFAGSITAFLGSLWLCKELIMVAGAICFTVLPWYTPAIIYLRYNDYGSLFETWWYASVTALQFIIGCMMIYLYAYLNKDLNERYREEQLKTDMGMMKFDRVPESLTAEPCGCKLWDGDMD